MKKYLLLLVIALCLFALDTLYVQAQTANGNIIYACYHKNTGDLRKVSGPGQCKNPEIQISWAVGGTPGPQGTQGPQGVKGETGATGETGAQGPQGQPGQSVTSEVIPIGDARCTNGVGGVQYTDSTGVRIVCNGQQGAQGEKGEKGETGSPGTGAAPSLYIRALPTRSAKRGSEGETTFDFSCLTGDKLTGGGFSAHHSLIVVESRPLDDDTWRVTINNPTENNSLGYSVHVICMDLTP